MWTHSRTPLSKGRGRGHLRNLNYTFTNVTSSSIFGKHPGHQARIGEEERGKGARVVVSPTHEVGNRLADDCAKDECAHEIGQEREGHAGHCQ